MKSIMLLLNKSIRLFQVQMMIKGSYQLIQQKHMHIERTNI